MTSPAPASPKAATSSSPTLTRAKDKALTPAPESPRPQPPKDDAPTLATASASASSPAAAKSLAAAPVESEAPEPEPASEPLPDEPDGIINMEIFSQIQDMDEDDDDEGGGHEFSKGIVWGYFEQAENTFKQMEEAIAEPSLWKLSSLGHFLKGSSAALGIVKVQNSCEKMQHYGNLRDEERDSALSEDEALRRIKKLLVDCKRDYAVASRWLRRLYEEEEEVDKNDA